MAQQRKTTSKSRSKASNTKAKAPQKKTPNRQLWSVVLFSLGVLLLMITFIEGTALWKVLHDTLRGLFGVSCYLIAPITLYVSIMIALDKSQSAVITKVIQGIVLVLLLSGTVQVMFVGKVAEGGFAAVIKSLFSQGKLVKGGGVAAAFMGWPLFAAFGRVGACIILILLAFVFIMLLTNLTLVGLFTLITKPFKTGYNAVRETSEERARQLAEQKKADEERAEKNRREAKVDLMPYLDEGRKKKPEKSEKAAKPEKPNKNDWQEADSEDVILPITAIKPAKKKTEEKTPYDYLVMANEKNKSKAETEPAVEDGDIPTPVMPVAVVNPDTVLTFNRDTAAAVEPTAAEIPEKKAEFEPEPVSDEPIVAETVKNPIYVEKDGQTTFFEKSMAKLEDGYNFPSIELLNKPSGKNSAAENQLEQSQNGETLVNTLSSFGIQTRIINIQRGPAITRYELQPAAGVSVKRITSLESDIKLALAAESLRIEAPIPGKAAVGIEVSNKSVDTINLREILETDKFKNAKSRTTFAIGKDITGEAQLGDVAKMPHVLVAGATGSGKSVCINSLIMSILYKAKPNEVKLIMIDPKMVELVVYNGIPHLLIPVVTDARKAAGALGWAVTEMQKRYKMFADNSVRNLEGYNALCEKNEHMSPLPQIVIIIDELADLMMVAAKEVEDSICRLTQLARAAGMHLVIATQRPSVNVITGVIKANIPSRIALAVSSQVDSRTILDTGGAEHLLGRGDMLYLPYGAPKATRIQGCYVADNEVENVVSFLKNTGEVLYDEEVLEEIEKNIPVAKGEKSESGSSDALSDGDEMLEPAIELIVDTGKASTSFLQTRLKLGYARAARIMDELEQMGIIGEPEGAKPRKVLLTKQEWLERKAMQDNNI